jgi:hypothetical protein
MNRVEESDGGASPYIETIAPGNARCQPRMPNFDRVSQSPVRVEPRSPRGRFAKAGSRRARCAQSPVRADSRGLDKALPVNHRLPTRPGQVERGRAGTVSAPRHPRLRPISARPGLVFGPDSF